MTQRTLNGTRLKKIRTSGFRIRMASKTGRRVINNRRKKGLKLLLDFSQLYKNSNPKNNTYHVRHLIVRNVHLRIRQPTQKH